MEPASLWLAAPAPAQRWWLPGWKVELMLKPPWDCRGGDLAVHWDGDQVWMTGPAELVFVGEWSATVPTREVVESTVER